MLLVCCALLLSLAARDVQRHVNAARVLSRLSEVDETEPIRVFDYAAHGARARAFVPIATGETLPAGLVLAHGVHHLGIDDPRFVRFARALAQSGLLVVTPEQPALTHYRTERAEPERLGASAHALAASLRGACAVRGGHDCEARRVGLMGISFGGGLGLAAASAPDAPRDVAYVVAIGAHGDLSRVARYFATNLAVAPDASAPRTYPPAHGYGLLVMSLQNADGLFAREDVPAAERALTAWLKEDRAEARREAGKMTAAGQTLFTKLVETRDAETEVRLLRAIDARSADLAAKSPNRSLRSLRVPAFILHGAGDSVIPASEAEWLAREIPHDRLAAHLISKALGHVDVTDATSRREQLALVHFMARVLETANDERS
jgi:pimeloyl-ACP methyl ester carboxylesterase